MGDQNNNNNNNNTSNNNNDSSTAAAAASAADVAAAEPSEWTVGESALPSNAAAAPALATYSAFDFSSYKSAKDLESLGLDSKIEKKKHCIFKFSCIYFL